jgi:hypothetical protein
MKLHLGEKKQHVCMYMPATVAATAAATYMKLMHAMRSRAQLLCAAITMQRALLTHMRAVPGTTAVLLQPGLTWCQACGLRLKPVGLPSSCALSMM